MFVMQLNEGNRGILEGKIERLLPTFLNVGTMHVLMYYFGLGAGGESVS